MPNVQCIALSADWSNTHIYLDIKSSNTQTAHTHPHTNTFWHTRTPKGRRTEKKFSKRFFFQRRVEGTDRRCMTTETGSWFHVVGACVPGLNITLRSSVVVVAGGSGVHAVRLHQYICEERHHTDQHSHVQWLCLQQCHRQHDKVWELHRTESSHLQGKSVWSVEHQLLSWLVFVCQF